MSFRTKARIFGVEIQKYIYDMGVDSIKENRMDKQIEFINEDIKEIDKIYESESFDIVTCNPPYFKYQEDSLINENEGKAIARHEVNVKLEDIISTAKYLLKNGGTFAMVHRPERLIEIINLMQKYGIEPKKIRLVYPKEDKNANILLIEGVKNGKSGLKVEKALIVHNNEDKYVEEIKDMFGSDNNVAEKL
jgi:tRNA1(Val) A37 N6-methylase TrmN6